MKFVNLVFWAGAALAVASPKIVDFFLENQYNEALSSKKIYAEGKIPLELFSEKPYAPVYIETKPEISLKTSGI